MSTPASYTPSAIVAAAKNAVASFSQRLKAYNVSIEIVFLSILIVAVLGVILGYIFYIRDYLQGSECRSMTNLYFNQDRAIRPINPNDANCKYSLRDYYIKTAYNCCSAGSYKNDYVDTCSLINVLRQGVRGLDFEIYSVNDNPVVSTSTQSSYYVKETYNYVNFTDVMSIIANYAFSSSGSPNPGDPIIFHLRFMSNNEKMFGKLAKIFESYNHLFLGPAYSHEDENSEGQKQNLGANPLLNFRNKIIVIADNRNKSFTSTKFYEYVNMTSKSIFMRALDYYNIKNTPDITELQTYNKQNMTISLPNLSAYPENPNAIICRELGCQMIGMCYQLNDVYLQENNQFFDNGGYAFVLKPENLRYQEITIPDATPPPAATSYATRTITTQYHTATI